MQSPASVRPRRSARTLPPWMTVTTAFLAPGLRFVVMLRPVTVGAYYGEIPFCQGGVGCSRHNRGVPSIDLHRGETVVAHPYQAYVNDIAATLAEAERNVGAIKLVD